MKIPGVTLIAAARPMPTPFHRESSGSEKSQRTRHRIARLICPYVVVPSTGSAHRAAAASSGAATWIWGRAAAIRPRDR